ncbi:DUF2283 domain-containing protein [Lentzea flava]|uniref:DUF2283 domain-containing protein n=1 Tax=Lentzea flava TaxID=103732 RepID=A0ABQ2UF57_9PSEU|nr:DUF2283 domain-containing protein [Lentzea flava]MCP2198635.1 Uncharacterized protein YuzE [Lentzea flava]GGU29020.1 hypothetical protein GCM10010178_21440 [Lentzea flava]
MTASPELSLEIDQQAGAAYLQFSSEQVARSVEFSDVIIVDLDEHNVVVGIELLDLAQSVPLDSLVERFHIRTEALALLMQSLRSSTSTTAIGGSAPSAAGTIAVHGVTRLTPA